MVEYAYLSMKLSNYYKSKELISTLGGVLCYYKRPILTLVGETCRIAKQINSTPCSFAHFIQAVLCSSLQLWIAVLTSPADSMWQLVISRQCTSKYDLCVALKTPLSGCCRSTAAPCPVCGLPRRTRVYRKVTDSCGWRGQSVSQRRGTYTH